MVHAFCSEVQGIIALSSYLARTELPDSHSAYGDVDAPTIVSILVSASFGKPQFARFEEPCRSIELSS